MGTGPPRLDKYARILSRLFEFLALFHILKRADGPHLVTFGAPADLQGVRRRFTKGLSFLCDYRKGGDTTTSIGLESEEGGVVFWIAANLTPKNNVIEFLSNVLEELRTRPDATKIDEETLRERLTERSIQFALPRLKKEFGLLTRATRKCEKYLRENIDAIKTPGISALLNWLAKFSSNTNPNPRIFCQIAYDARHDSQMETLAALVRELQVAPQEVAELFQRVRHFVGRLAERIRVPTNVVRDSLSLGPLLQNYRITVKEAPAAAEVPLTDGLRNLDSILKRMLPAGDPRLGDMQLFMARMNGPLQLEDAIRSMYDDDENKHYTVHAEIQLAEEFHRNQRTFVGNDRYIACSKLACLCCKLYFKWHPGGFIEPESHQKVHLNWRPVSLPGGGEDEHWPDQRRILGMISKGLSNAVEEQIITRQQPTPWQPDSITNITAEIDSLRLSEIENVVDSGDGGSDDSGSLGHINEFYYDTGLGSSDEGSQGGAGLGD